MNNYDNYEAECGKIKTENKKVIVEFESYLSEKKLTASTIKKHSSNISFFINEFLLYEEPLRPKEGMNRIDYFLGHWFIRKAMWSSVATLKENITSLKHFYAYLNSIGSVTSDEVFELKAAIKENKATWLATMHQYDNQGINF